MVNLITTGLEISSTGRLMIDKQYYKKRPLIKEGDKIIKCTFNRVISKKNLAEVIKLEEIDPAVVSIMSQFPHGKNLTSGTMIIEANNEYEHFNSDEVIKLTPEQYQYILDF